MIIRNNSLFILLALLLVAGNHGITQEFKIRATLDPVPVSGFYKIPITTELSAIANADFSDLRILNDSNIFVPYINHREISRTPGEKFNECKILTNKNEGNYTIIVMENASFAEGLNNTSLVLSNTAVERFTSLSGSDDQNKWYIIDDSIKFHRSFTNADGTYTQTIIFPLSKYRYFRLKINNAHTDPLKIIKAGTYKLNDTVSTTSFINNPLPGFIQKDSNKITYVLINNKAPYLTDKITFHITAPRLFNRSVILFVMHNATDSNGLREPAGSFTLSSDSLNIVTIKSQKALTILAEIKNEDNPPLKLSGITTSQELQHVICWLDSGKTYTLLAGNPTATAPVYDLSVFKKDIPGKIVKLNYGPLKEIPTPAVPTVKPSKNYWLWPAIILAVLVLSLLTYRLMKDMKKSEG